MKRSRGQTLWRRVLATALRQGYRLARERQGDVIAVGIGYKHSAAQGYGSVEPSLKFFVRRKTELRLLKQPLPTVITAAGKRVRTDVEVLRRPTQHRPPCVSRDGGTTVGDGVPGFMMRNGNQKVLITAGHVLVGSLGARRSATLRVFVDTQQVGDVDLENTYFLSPQTQELYDIGVSRIAPGVALGLPTASRLATDDDLIAWFDGSRGQQIGDVLTRTGAKSVILDSRVGRLAWRADQPPYAPVLIHVRAQGEDTFVPGDSGSPLVTEQGRVLAGIHVLGDNAHNQLGWAVATPTIREQLNGRTGQRWSLVA